MFYECRLAPVMRIASLYTAFEATRAQNYRFPGEAHDFWEVVCVLDGMVGVTAGTDICMLRAGQMIVHPPMEFHRLWSEGGSAPTTLIFSFQAAQMPPLAQRIFEFGPSSGRALQEALYCIRQNFEMEDIGVRRIRAGCACQAQIAVNLLENALLDVLASHAGAQLTPVRPHAQQYTVIVQAMEAHLHEHLTMEGLARYCRMSVPNLKKVFSKYAGIGVMRYYNELKMKRARQLLEQGRTNKEIAALLGFRDQNYFSTVFKRIVGCAPSCYQKASNV